jgi:hypothetical protein
MTGRREAIAMRRIALALVVAVFSLSVALADSSLTWQSTPLGGEWVGYLCSLHDANEAEASWAVNVEFSVDDGTLLQQQAFGYLPVTRQSNAENFDSIDPDYDMDFDSWVCSPFESLVQGITEAENAFHIHAGTPGGQAYGDVPLAYLVTDGRLRWDGAIARQGVDYPVTSAPAPVVPEPVDPPEPADVEPEWGPPEASLTWESAPLEGDWVSYTCYLQDDSGAEASWAANMEFSTSDGTLRQQSAFGTLPVHTQADADLYDGLDPDYDMALDTWVYSPFGPLVEGITESEDAFHIHVGTPGGERYGRLPLAHVVTDGQLHWDGVVARRGVAFPVTSDPAPPDPGPGEPADPIDVDPVEPPPPPPPPPPVDPPDPEPEGPDDFTEPTPPNLVYGGGPEVLWDSVDLGDGRHGYTIYVTDSQCASWAVNIDFWGCDGTAAQLLAFGALDVNTEADARVYGFIDPNFSMALDSWVFDEWCALPTGILGAPDEAFHVHAGTPGGVAVGSIPLAYIVARGWIDWEGTVSRLGVTYYTCGWTPEPVTGSLLLVGVALRRRRRASRVFHG